MEFNYSGKREFHNYSQRSVTMGCNGMVASSQSLATLAGYKALARGGNAIDAAVAMVSTLNVVEPHSVGIGGDAFALIYLAEQDKIIGMNASGRAPHNATIAAIQQKGLKEIPMFGVVPVTVPGALKGWADAVRKYGKLTLAEVFEDAIGFAENGFPVSQVIAGEWKNVENVLIEQSGKENNPYLPSGHAPRPGQRFYNPELAATYKKIVELGVDTFYQGELGNAIVDYIQRQQGFLDKTDLANHTTTWVEPISSTYRGYTVYELPPNGQGMTALQMLNILEGYEMANLGHNSPEYLHLIVEAKKLAFCDRDYFITDPEFEEIPLETLLSKEYAAQCRKRIDLTRAKLPERSVLREKKSDTVYVSAVDAQGNAVSFISSIFCHFGSGKVVDKTGIVLQNRGWSFSLDQSHPNHLLPNKRPMHTIIPGMLFKEGRFLMSFGVMGADFQPQGHVQLLMNLIDFNMNPQEAMDAPRICHLQEKEIYLEGGFSAEVAEQLRGKGHKVTLDTSPINMVGGGQAIYKVPGEDVLLGASDRRKDGSAIGY